MPCCASRVPTLRCRADAWSCVRRQGRVLVCAKLACAARGAALAVLSRPFIRVCNRFRFSCKGNKRCIIFMYVPRTVCFARFGIDSVARRTCARRGCPVPCNTWWRPSSRMCPFPQGASRRRRGSCTRRGMFARMGQEQQASGKVSRACCHKRWHFAQEIHNRSRAILVGNNRLQPNVKSRCTVITPRTRLVSSASLRQRPRYIDLSRQRF